MRFVSYQDLSTCERTKGSLAPCLVAALSPGGSLETPPCWHATIYILIYVLSRSGSGSKFSFGRIQSLSPTLICSRICRNFTGLIIYELAIRHEALRFKFHSFSATDYGVSPLKVVFSVPEKRYSGKCL